MPSASERELEHYRMVAEEIYAVEGKDKDQINACAKMLLAEIKHYLPDTSDTAIRSFLASVGFMMAKLTIMPLHDVADAMEAIFDHHMIATAALLGIVNLDEGNNSGPTVDEIVEKIKDIEKTYKNDDPDKQTGMFL